jgi:hypothetical protein
VKIRLKKMGNLRFEEKNDEKYVTLYAAGHAIGMQNL